MNRASGTLLGIAALVVVLAIGWVVNQPNNETPQDLPVSTAASPFGDKAPPKEQAHRSSDEDDVGPITDDGPRQVAKPTAGEFPPEQPDDVPWRLLQFVHDDPGPPAAWRVDAPEHYRKPVFTDTMESIVEQCDLSQEIVDVSCDEPPCMVAFSAPGGTESPTRCAGWASAWGSGTVAHVAFDVDCPDGRTVRAEFVTPFSAEAASVVETDEAFDPMARMTHRATNYTVSDWCGETRGRATSE